MVRLVMLSIFGLLCVSFLAGCTAQPMKLDPAMFYKRDLPYSVQGVGSFEGVSVLPRRAEYVFEIAPKGNAVVDLLLVTTCHREEAFEQSAPNWIEKLTGKKKVFVYTYRPMPGIEDTGDCDLRFNTYEKNLGRHAWALVKMESELYQLPATMYCNGKTSTNGGVSVCQSKAGLAERIEFDDVVMIEGQAGCNKIKKVGQGHVGEFDITAGECVYTMMGVNGTRHLLTTLGYQGVLIREVDSGLPNAISGDGGSDGRRVLSK